MSDRRRARADLAVRARDALRTLHEQGRIRSPWRDGMWAGGRLVSRSVMPLVDGVPRAASEEALSVWLEAGPADVSPDPTDPATLGCLMALLREATGYPGLHTLHDHIAHDWCVMRGAHIYPHARTEAEAVVSALEAVAND